MTAAYNVVAYSVKTLITTRIFSPRCVKVNTNRYSVRKICLILDNCSAHNVVTKPSNLQVKFLPPKTNSVLQPWDSGIIYAFKQRYKKELLLRYLSQLDNINVQSFDLSLLDAINLMKFSWRQITPATIKNCFKKAGSCPIADKPHSNDFFVVEGHEAFEEVFNRPDFLNLEDYIIFDDCLVTNVELSVNEIVQAVAPTDNQTERVEIDDQGDPQATIHVTKVLESLVIQQIFFVQEGIEDPKDFDNFRMIMTKKCFDAKKKHLWKNFSSLIIKCCSREAFFPSSPIASFGYKVIKTNRPRPMLYPELTLYGKVFGTSIQLSIWVSVFHLSSTRFYPIYYLQRNLLIPFFQKFVSDKISSN